MTVSGPPVAGPETPAVRNKRQQVIGPKGRQTRARLMECGRLLLDRCSPSELTAVAIAKLAEVTIGAYYLYFEDVSDLLYELSSVASAELAGLDAVLTQDWAECEPAEANAGRFVDAFVEVWARHRPVLLYLNLEAHRGDARFAELRIAQNRPLVAALGDRIYAAGGRSRGEARLEAMLLITALSGFAGADPAHSEREFGVERITQGLTAMFGRALSPAE